MPIVKYLFFTTFLVKSFCSAQENPEDDDDYEAHSIRFNRQSSFWRGSKQFEPTVSPTYNAAPQNSWPNLGSQQRYHSDTSQIPDCPPEEMEDEELEFGNKKFYAAATVNKFTNCNPFPKQYVPPTQSYNNNGVWGSGGQHSNNQAGIGGGGWGSGGQQFNHQGGSGGGGWGSGGQQFNNQDGSGGGGWGSGGQQYTTTQRSFVRLNQAPTKGYGQESTTFRSSAYYRPGTQAPPMPQLPETASHRYYNMEPYVSTTVQPFGGYPTQKPFEYPAQKPFEYPTQKPFEYPTQKPFEYPTQKPFEYPTQKPFGYPTEPDYGYPTERSFEYTTKRQILGYQNPTQKPFEYTSKPQSQYPTEKPFEYTTKSQYGYPTEAQFEYNTKRPLFEQTGSTQDAFGYTTKSPFQYPTEKPFEYTTKVPLYGSPTEKPFENSTYRKIWYPTTSSPYTGTGPSAYTPRPTEDSSYGSTQTPKKDGTESYTESTKRPPILDRYKNSTPKPYKPKGDNEETIPNYEKIPPKKDGALSPFNDDYLVDERERNSQAQVNRNSGTSNVLGLTGLMFTVIVITLF